MYKVASCNTIKVADRKLFQEKNKIKSSLSLFIIAYIINIIKILVGRGKKISSFFRLLSTMKKGVGEEMKSAHYK